MQNKRNLLSAKQIHSSCERLYYKMFEEELVRLIKAIEAEDEKELGGENRGGSLEGHEHDRVAENTPAKGNDKLYKNFKPFFANIEELYDKENMIDWRQDHDDMLKYSAPATPMPLSTLPTKNSSVRMSAAPFKTKEKCKQ